MSAPALAVIGRDGQLERSTSAFSSSGAASALLDGASTELERVLNGEASSAMLTAGGVTAAVEAVVDARGGRHAVLTLSDADAAKCSSTESSNPLLDEDFDSSPAVIFLKDLDGRYLRVNAMHGKLIGGGEAQLLGKTDRELAAKLTVDGPRLDGRDESLPDPAQLAYIVPAFEKRPALSVLRFLVHDEQGEPVALCGVAAPLEESTVAEAEAERLMTLERVAHLDPATARTELLSQWGLLGGAAAETSPTTRGQAIPDALVARAAEGEDDAVSRLLAEERLRAQGLEQALADAEAALAAVSASVSGEESEEVRLRAEQARVQAEQARAEADHLRSEMELVRAEVEQARAVARREHEDAESARAVAQSARSEASQALVRIEQLQAEAAALSSRLDQAETDAREWRMRAEQAEVEAVQARAKADQADTDARTARARAEEAGTATRQAESRAEQAESAARVAKSRADQAETEARQARAAAEQAESEARQARTRAEQGEVDARLAVARAEHAEAEARQAQLRAEEAESSARQAIGRAERTEATLVETKAQLEKAEAESRQARALQQESEAAVLQWRARAEQAESELQQARERASESAKPAAGEAANAASELRQRLQSVQSERDAATNQAAQTREELAAERARTDELRRTLAQTQERLTAVAGEVEAARARQAVEIEQLRAELAAQAARAAAELEDLRTAEEEQRRQIHEQRQAAEARPKARGRAFAEAPSSSGLRWGATAQRELAAALGDVEDLRSGLHGAAGVLGTHGGWDLVAVWLPDPRGLLRCTASWAVEGLRELEQLTLRSAQPVHSSDLGAALYAREPVSFAVSAGATSGQRVAELAAAGVEQALLLPIRDGVARIGLLELLSQSEEAPSGEVVLALEAVGLQLGQFAALTRARLGRR